MNGDRRIYRVFQASDQLWHVVREGLSRPHLTAPTKERAVLLAKRLAKASPVAEVLVYSSDGALCSRQLFVHETREPEQPQQLPVDYSPSPHP